MSSVKSTKAVILDKSQASLLLCWRGTSSFRSGIMVGETKNARSTLSHAFSCSLGQQINASSRSAHFLLNRLIVSRLPLALPPHATNPSIYILGLLHIAPLYTTFETVWESFLDSKTSQDPLGICRDCDTCGHQIHYMEAPSPLNRPIANDPSPADHLRPCPRLRSLLAHVHQPDLLRSTRLCTDIRSACRISETELDERFRRVSESGEVAHVCEGFHIRYYRLPRARSRSRPAQRRATFLLHLNTNAYLTVHHAYPPIGRNEPSCSLSLCLGILYGTIFWRSVRQGFTPSCWFGFLEKRANIRSILHGEYK